MEKTSDSLYMPDPVHLHAALLLGDMIANIDTY
jgi:hypothetical protein